MADAKKCDVCGAYFDSSVDGYELHRHDPGLMFGMRNHWDLCSATCVSRATKNVLALQVLDDAATILATGADWRTVIGTLREAVVAMGAR